MTTGSRVRLYVYLDRLQLRAIYCDTEAVFCIRRKRTSTDRMRDNLVVMTGPENISTSLSVEGQKIILIGSTTIGMLRRPL